jgi:hypothetical protein
MDPITEPDVEAAWSAEIKRRLAEIDAGTVELIPWEDVRAELFGESEMRVWLHPKLARHFASRVNWYSNAVHHEFSAYSKSSNPRYANNFDLLSPGTLFSTNPAIPLS